MRRKEFGRWGEQVDDRTFWQAVAMLGVLGGLGIRPPRNLGELEEIVAGRDFPELSAQPYEESPGVLWLVDQESIESAQLGDLVDARRLAAWWEDLRRGEWYVRLQSPELFSNQQEIASALHVQAKAVLYFPLRPLTSAEDWKWPMRIAVSRPERQQALWQSIQDWKIQSDVVSQLVRFSQADGEPAVELLVLPGQPAEALEELEAFPVPIRTHCLILLTEDGIEIDETQVSAVFRLQQLTLAKGVVISSQRDANPAKWIVALVYGLTHNMAIDQVLSDIDMPLPLMFFDPSLFRMARVGNFAEKIALALESAGDAPLDLGPDAARGIALGEGRYRAVEVAYRLRDALRQPDFFDSERHGTTWSVDILKAAREGSVLKRDLSEFMVSYAAGEGGAERRLQVDVLDEDGRPARLFHSRSRYDVDAWIGHEEGALSGTAFPEELLPGEEDGHLLTVTFFAPGHTEQPIVEAVYLPRAGESSRCRFSFKTSAQVPHLEARITIAFRNRVLQTYLLTGSPEEEIAMTPEMATEAGWQGLDSQSPYGAAIVLNKMQGRHQATMQAGYKALAFSLDGLDDAMTLMESKLDSSNWESPDFQGVKAKGSGKLILYLAKHGSSLFEAMKQYAPAGKAGQAFLNNLLNADPVQVLAANLGARLPVELFYANPYPQDGARLCPTYDDEPDRRSCDGCAHVNRDHYCPLGFWSLRKVIEWHDFEAAKKQQKDFAPRQFAVQAADGGQRRDRLGEMRQVLVGLSRKAGLVDKNVEKDLKDSIRRAGLDLVMVKDWEEWKDKIAADEPPRLLVLIPHTEKNEFDEECLEICGKTIASGLIDHAYVAGKSRPGPIVLLIGCNTENLGIPFRNFPVKFMTGGSAIVVSTISYVLGRHAAPLAAELVETIAAAQEHTTFGSLMRDVRRKWLKSNQPPITLGLKCYGDARWRF